uniref:WW domain-containing protein n=1 Tax=Phaeocystis antarctica TaxID=33657 RepID=A0A7S0E2L5_9EUKA|mmetsp:Transcript_14226/g.33548  ORF Transcript_14226/g.33548 Transcript_14226/m.33548 type:complete len:213 (+) Transcript_14226:39-677(+)
MADEEPLAEGWEAVTDDAGRTYWWNTETNETTWTKPVAVLAKKGLAAGYLSKVGSTEFEKSSKPDDLARLRQQGGSSGGVSARLAQFNRSTSLEDSAGPKSAAEKDPAVYFDGSMVGSVAVGRAQQHDIHYGKRGTDKVVEQPPELESARSLPAVDSPAMVEGRKSTLSVHAMKKLQEAKQFLNAKDEAPQKAAAAARDPRANAKPKVDLFS